MKVVKKPSEIARRIGLAYLWSFGFWMVWCLMISRQEYALGWASGDHKTFFHLWRIIFVGDFAFAILTPSIFYLVGRFPVGLDKPSKGVFAYLFGFIPFLISYACIRCLFTPMWSIQLQRFVPRSFSALQDFITVTIFDVISCYTAVVVGAHAYEYFKRARAQELEQHELQQLLVASELQTLRSQLHPHFLFNTLHGISTLVDTDRPRAKAMVIKLSSLLRAALQHDSSNLIPLQQEIKFIQSYVDLEKMRLGTRLDVRWNIHPGTEEVLVPQMILQPLVENAMLHGIACCREGGWIEIFSRRTEGFLELRVQNSVGGKSQRGMGLGLNNTAARLKYLYSDEATFSFAVSEGHVATSTLNLPAFGSRHQASADVSILSTQG
jgi:two-component system, LytTR family, sensor kinase